MSIPNIPANFLVTPGNGQVYLAWSPTVGATSASTGVPTASTGQYDVLRSIDGLNFSLVSSINTNSYRDIAATTSSSGAGGPSTGVVYYYSVRANGNNGQSQQALAIQTTLVNFGQTTLGAVRLAAQQRADMINNDFVTTQEWNDYINHSYTELYDILIQTYADEYFVTSFSFNTDGRFPALYNLPNNIYKLMGVDLGISPNNNAFLTLKKFSFISRNRYIYGNTPLSFLGVLQLRYRLVGNQIEFVPQPASNQQVQLWYIPRPITLLADSDVLDGISGWDEYVIVDAAIKALQKEESDVTILMAQKQALLLRIQAAASNRDEGQGEAATDLRRIDGTYFSDPFGDGPMGGW